MFVVFDKEKKNHGGAVGISERGGCDVCNGLESTGKRKKGSNLREPCERFRSLLL